MAHIWLSDFVYDCTMCHTRCDGISKGVYHFENDASFSEAYEQDIIQAINQLGGYNAIKTVEAGYPDIEIQTLNKEKYRYLEVKVQQRTFMQVQKYLPESKLVPSETVALNLSDLSRYFTVEQQTGIPIIVVWVLLNRPCIVKQKFDLYFQSCTELKKIFVSAGGSRRFRRQSGEGDMLAGIHKGVTVNYHFSLKELLPWHLSFVKEKR